MKETGADRTTCAGLDDVVWDGNRCNCKPGYCAIHKFDRHGRFFAGSWLGAGYEFGCYEIAKDSFWSSDSCCSKHLQTSILGWGKGNYDGTCLESTGQMCNAPDAKCDDVTCTCPTGCAEWTENIRDAVSMAENSNIAWDGMFICNTKLGGALATARPLAAPFFLVGMLSVLSWSSSW